MIKEYFPKIKKTIKKLLYVLIIEIIIFVVFVGYEFLTWRKYINTLNSKSEELSQKSENFVMLNTMSKESENIKIYIEDLQNKIFKKDEYEKFVSNLPNTISSLGFKNVDLSISEEKRILENKDYFEVNINISFDGTLQNTLSFLNYIENLNKFININNFNYSITKEGVSVDLSFSIPIF
jgi:Tfp pilus assembly protein PilO